MRRSWLPVVLACSALGGCGQTGGLYLPDEDSEAVSEVPSPDPATQADADRERSDEQRRSAPQ